MISGFFGAVLGIFESGLFPGIVMYFSSMYTRGELAVGIGVFYKGGSLSGAFRGLLARGLSAIGPRANWNRALEREELFQWSEVLRGIFNVQIWVNSTSYFAIVSGLYSLGLFLPTIVKEIGITGDANQVQLWSVIPFAIAAPMLMGTDGDRVGIRGVIMLCVIPIAIAGYAVIANVKQPETRFAMTCLMALGMVLANVFWCAKINHDKARGKYNEYTGSGMTGVPSLKWFY
ncbi:major facilitator superfamily transporter [Beauveria bassiana ARSEF 2860]|uniref:Major facilitator superfamily transporter n=1 Tax=Beauveria bassiana (strain ARSEF 2860) TaxID=655819 RepID=J4UV01_BEAB2|nr:major facilitator superfamily transporter [Beauveria bassiana ARSEF 2860]EJP69892.1 major facilitator superfamily transporter [Beauveria bassiana ARSEF 2860]